MNTTTIQQDISNFCTGKQSCLLDQKICESRAHCLTHMRTVLIYQDWEKQLHNLKTP